ncbi:tRNA (guanosine(46)-N7)-methyltransferase TrmB [Sediminicurvatus halobius]|uniref:tRNA (guanine-N(7)-)-methyltransferase n=1 Tax=Sediminicurvatus halobius TaxID=2182432 RepID=A0A2U2N220_9GAMM|nr:tRNA (guanosine(46)-N7)-methyltransferase TrmB [Spiribacter halobius]PWG63150.1 tRNA (guanosine(46)-N7)-methyltransferase TrmB [Spiribacter halobius]UEX77599.1 tRNA (guanosine(46)-N7)-methyltransferase TrmB [Spiribacter halobius]
MKAETAPPGAARRIRSFVRREGRLTPGQQRALDELYPRFGLTRPQGLLDLDAAFGRTAPVVLDIGFGDGEALAELALSHPERNYLGIEVYRSGVGRLLRTLEREGIDNVRVLEADAVEVLRQNIPPASLAGLQLFFPDPWPKKRHHKRRMVQPGWLALVAERLAPGAFLHLATDWADYAEHMLAVVGSEPRLENPAGGFAPDRGERPQTKFERRGRSKGHQVYDLILRRRDGA